MVICLSLFLLVGGFVDYVPADQPLNGSGLRGFRPTGPGEVILEEVGGEDLLIFTGWQNRHTAIYSRSLAADAQEWSDSVRLSSKEALFDSLPSVWTSPQGEVHCVWQSKTRSESFEINYARRAAGSREWTPPVGIGEANGDRRSPVFIRGTEEGKLFVVSHNWVPGYLYPGLRAFWSGDGGRSWEESHPLASLEAEQVSLFDPRIAVTEKGELYLLVLRTQHVTTVFLTSSPDGGRSWTPPVALNEHPSPRIQDPGIWASNGLVQAVWVDQPEGGGETRRLEAAFVSSLGDERRVVRELLHEVSHVRTLSYAGWRNGPEMGITWLERLRKGNSAVRKRVTARQGEISLEEISTVAESREGFHFEEFAISPHSDVVLMTEKKIVTPPALQLCSETAPEGWQCEKIHTTSGRSDILAPMLVAEEQENLYRVIFHEVLFKFEIFQTILDTTIVSGTVTLNSGDGGASDGGGKQGDASSSQFK